MRTRRAATVSVLTLACFAGATPASADTPVVAPNCTAAVGGTPGQEVALDPTSLTDPLTSALADVDPLGLVGGTFREVWQGVPVIPVGTVPAGEALIPGAQIADAVTAELGELPVLALVLEPLTPAVREALTSLCGIVARGVLPGAPKPDAPPAPKPEAPNAPGQGAPGGTAPGDDGLSATERYYLQGRQAGSRSSGAAVFGSPLDLAGFGQPGAVPRSGPAPVAQGETQRYAGSARTAPPTVRDDVPVPVLLALLLLALVGALLVRRWVLRTQR